MRKRKPLRSWLGEYSLLTLTLCGIFTVSALTFAASVSRGPVNLLERRVEQRAAARLRLRVVENVRSSNASSSISLPSVHSSSASAGKKTDNALPDYFVSAVAVESRSGKADVFAVVMNRGGAADGSSSALLQYNLNGTGRWTAVESVQSVPPLGGKDGKAEVEWSGVGQISGGPFPAGKHRVRVCADAALQVAESNEANNCSAALEFTVLPRTTP